MAEKGNQNFETNSLNQQTAVPLESTIPFHPYESVRVSLSRAALQILYCNIGMRTEDECFVAQLWFVSGGMAKIIFFASCSFCSI